MQHSGVLWWLVAMALVGAGVAVAGYCRRVGCYYEGLLQASCPPDAVTLLNALGQAARSPVPAIIRAQRTPCALSAYVLWCLAPGACLLGVWYGHGLTWYSAALSLLIVCLFLLSCIDWYTGLLPDALCLPLLWMGLALAWAGMAQVSLHDSLSGVMLGYVLLAGLRLFFLWRYKVDALGQGDIKLLAALGAWLGPEPVIHVLFLACVAAILFAMVVQRRLRPRGSVPFGPFLSFGGLCAIALAFS